MCCALCCEKHSATQSSSCYIQSQCQCAKLSRGAPATQLTSPHPAANRTPAVPYRYTHRVPLFVASTPHPCYLDPVSHLGHAGAWAARGTAPSCRWAAALLWAACARAAEGRRSMHWRVPAVQFYIRSAPHRLIYSPPSGRAISRPGIFVHNCACGPQHGLHNGVFPTSGARFNREVHPENGNFEPLNCVLRLQSPNISSAPPTARLQFEQAGAAQGWGLPDTPGKRLCGGRGGVLYSGLRLGLVQRRGDPQPWVGTNLSAQVSTAWPLAALWEGPARPWQRWAAPGTRRAPPQAGPGPDPSRHAVLRQAHSCVAPATAAGVLLPCALSTMRHSTILLLALGALAIGEAGCSPRPVSHSVEPWPAQACRRAAR